MNKFKILIKIKNYTILGLLIIPLTYWLMPNRFQILYQPSSNHPVPMSTSYIILSLILITQIALLVLESAVAIIQSYVFAVLSTLYSSEVN